ncbi:MAG: eIF2A-related protein [Aggregatilineales bacterium]
MQTQTALSNQLGRQQIVTRHSWLDLVVMVSLILAGQANAQTVRASIVFETAPPSTVAASAPLPQLLRVFTGHQGAINSVAFSPDGKYFLTGSDDQTARLWDVQIGSVVHELSGHHGAVQSVAFSPDGKYILTGSKDFTAKLWDAETGDEVRQFVGHTDWVNAVAFSPDGKRIVTGSQDQTARVWDVQTGQTVRTLTQAGSVLSVAYDYWSTGTVLTAGSDGAVRLWNTQTGELINTFNEHSAPVNAVTFRRDCSGGACYASEMLSGSQDGTTILWDEQQDRTSTYYVLSNQHGPVRSVAASPDGDFVLMGNDDQTASLWNIDITPGTPDTFSGTLLGNFGNRAGAVNSVAFSSDNLYILTGSANSTAALWSFYDVASHYPSLHLREFSSVYSLSFVDPLNGWALVDTHSPYFSQTETQPNTGIRVTHDGGQTWQPLALAPTGVTTIQFTSLQDGWAFYSNPCYLPVGFCGPKDVGDTLWSTHDGGLTWQHIHVKGSGTISDVAAMGNAIWVVEQQCPITGDCLDDLYSLLLKSDDGGQIWQTVTHQMPISLLFLISPQDAIYTSYYPNTEQTLGFFVITQNGGRSWQTVPNPCWGYSALAALNPQRIWLICDLAHGTQDDEPKAVYATTDGGSHWRTISDSDVADQIPDFGTPTGLVFTSATRGFALFDRRGLWDTFDGGRTWVRNSFDNGVDWQDNYSGLRDLFFIDDTHGWFRAKNWGSIYRTADDGLHWEEILVP